MSELVLCLKFGKKTHIENLQRRGLIHMRPTWFFREIEDAADIENLRKDRFEGASYIMNKGKLQISIENEIVAYSINPELIVRAASDSGYIFCMTSVSEDQLKGRGKSQLPISDDTKNLGDTVLIIYNMKKFAKLFDDRMTSLGTEYRFHQVTYREMTKENYSYSIFQKPSTYEYQNESRIFIEKEEKEEFLNLEIGSLEDFSLVLPTTKLESLEVEFTRTNPVDNTAS